MILAAYLIVTPQEVLSTLSKPLEFNKQREKTSSQVYNESNTLQHIYSERAKLRIIEAGKLYGENHPKPTEGLASLPKALESEKGRTREKLSETLGIPQKKLETIMEVGKLAETGMSFLFIDLFILSFLCYSMVEIFARPAQIITQKGDMIKRLRIFSQRFRTVSILPGLSFLHLKRLHLILQYSKRKKVLIVSVTTYI
jgi:hypothetical protein